MNLNKMSQHVFSSLVLIFLILIIQNQNTKTFASNPVTSQQETRPRVSDPKHSKATQTNDHLNSSQDSDFVIKSDLVVLDVSVFDSENHLVNGLKLENFQILEDQVPQKIEYLSNGEAPISLGFVIDTSGSMRHKLPTVIKSALEIVKSAKKGDEFFVIDFKEKAELVEEFTTRIADIEDTLNNMMAGSGTAMLDALAVSAEYAQKEGKNRRKAIVVMSDGDDRDSFYNRKQLINLMHEYDVQVYIVGFPDESNSENGAKSKQKKATELISELAKESGGHAFFPESINQITSIANQINADLRAQYSIGYYPTNDKADGTYRKISVHITNDKRKLTLRTRTGYTAPNENKNNKK